MRSPTSLLITGASSGLGAALARDYAGPGRHLALTGRQPERLAAVAAECRARGATVRAAVLDVTERAPLAAWIAACDAAAPIDLVIANAGISGGTSGAGGESDDQVRRLFAVNVDGVLNTVQPLIPPMRARRRGQIALMASLAAFRGFPGAPAYCATKAAVRLYGEGLRGVLKPDGIGVSVICPGFVRTAMTAANRFPMPFLMDAEDAARRIRHGLARDRARIAFPRRLYALAWLAGALPPGWTGPWLDRLPGKAPVQDA